MNVAVQKYRHLNLDKLAQRKRTIVSTADALKDVPLINWSDKVISKKMQILKKVKGISECVKRRTDIASKYQVETINKRSKQGSDKGKNTKEIILQNIQKQENKANERQVIINAHSVQIQIIPK